MTLNDVLQDLIQHLETKGNNTIVWEQVRQWPEGAVEIFQNAEWIKPAAPAKSVVCPGCEENCFMPVHVSPAMQGLAVNAYVACDRRDDMGRIPIPPEMLQQWQITESQVAQWVARELGLRGKPKKDKTTQIIQVGDVQGKKKFGKLEMVSMEPVSLRASGHLLSFKEVVFLDGNQLGIDNQAIMNVVDRPPPSDRYKPSITRREARKLDTLARHKGWQKAYRDLKRNKQGKSDNWCAQQIARMPIGKDFSSETIRKNMKK